ncbi:FAD-binding oxidoreductase [Cellulomonas carbonis]|uniref:FAD-linked oxidase n=1 Tax=Cellulomonas carbonis T26 TaxID=947969 RepID=A0A0A0BQ15_9CELL|nr:FAD-binding oxidoreductase [Cellulomonas carbonis]KGM10055.1 FAD-linked oxidase [Cellulomonas carbonis T26]GGC18343.1 FAD-linked oxidase [Cellulomonas carbonis]
MTSTTPPTTTDPNPASTLTAAALADLRAALPGAVVVPDDERWAALATPWNLAVASRPAAVVDARSADDVVAAVRAAHRHGLRVAVRSTGHGAVEGLDGALLVHTGRLDECVVHPDGWARAGAGVRWQQVLEAAAPHGLVGAAGSSPHVGVVGYTTGGGLGPLARSVGLASDLVRAFEVVTGDGVLRRATRFEHPDLFWALRGGKGAAGIVTAVEMDLVPLGRFLGGALWFDGADAAAVLHTWRTWSADLPEAATTSVALVQLPPMPGVPEPLAGRLTVSVRFVWTGDPADGEQRLAPMRGAAAPLIDGVRLLTGPELGSVHADPVDPLPAAETSDLLRELPAEAVDALLAVAGPGSRSPQAIVEIRQLGGAVGRRPEEGDAVDHRDAAYTLNVIGMLVPPVADLVGPHGEAVRSALAPWTTGGLLPNFAAAPGEQRLARAYDDGTRARLSAVADRYDPDAVLRDGLAPVRTRRL